MKPVASLVALLLLGGCASHLNPPDQTIHFEETDWHMQQQVRYSPEDWPQALFADIYLPDDVQSAPAVLLVHGGGWEGRSRDDMDSIAETLASRGFAVMNIDYRFAPAYRFPAQLHDLQQAMHWLHRQSTKLNIDTRRIGAFGYSSGAHLVSLLALVASEGGPLDSPYGGPETRPVAVVAGGTPSDLRKFGDGKLVEQFLGGTIETHPDAYTAASPVTHITADAPPFFLYHGAWDSLVPTDHATDFQAALAAKGIPTEMEILRLRGHITTFLFSGSAIDDGIQFLGRQMGMGD
ncbi:MAG: lipase [Alteromonadaceae bacterium]|mgnify:CR=1 FL=1|nr:lipase [Alteromonadaceae bacterium]MBH85055.1 lipase [Alteromonadaceae bacterium]|tara:strand:+ start:50716 stop:51594 length:879 start_codon:yes stop_codon:yes gene_type:complete